VSLILVIVLFASQMSYYEAKDTTFGCTSIEEVSRLRSLRSDQMAFQIALLEKQILLRDEYGYVLAISLNHIRLDDLKMQLGLDVELADEYEIEELFDDCVRGAIPPAGECYGLDTVVDDSIEDQPEVYLEGGDHATLVHMSHAQFALLTATARHGSFSVHA